MQERISRAQELAAGPRIEGIDDSRHRTAQQPKCSPPVDTAGAHVRRFRHRLRRELGGAWALLAMCAALAAFCSQAQAHLFPAVAPVFDEGPCILRVDKADDATLQLEYSVPTDDTEFDAEDIVLDDSKTHQFFALRGMLAPNGTSQLFFPFDGKESATAMPIWITSADVKRAAMTNNGTTLLPGLAEAEIPADMTLSEHAVLGTRFVRITQDAARVPITKDQTATGLTWDLTDVEPGVYVIAGYIFSPPANGWASAPGLVSLHEGGQGAPAVVLHSIRGLLTNPQGRQVSGCVDAPQGSELRIDYQWVEDPDARWHSSFVGEVADEDSFEHCLVPEAGRSGSLRVRAQITAPDGGSMQIHSPDTATVLASNTTCEPSETICCEGGEPTMEVDEVVPPDAGVTALSTGTPMMAPPPEMPDDPIAAPTLREAGCGCSAAGRGPWRMGTSLGLVWIALALAWRRRGCR